MTALWALTIASWFAIAVLALALAGFIGQLRTLQAQLRAGVHTATAAGGLLPDFPDRQVLLVDPQCQACGGLMDHPLIGDVAVLTPAPSTRWPAHAVVDERAFLDLDPPFVPALARTGPDGTVLELVPVSGPEDFTKAVQDHSGLAHETKG